MPQLDFSTFLPQLVWLAITFSVLYLIMVKVAIPRIGGAIEDRQNKIANDLDLAQSMKADTDRAIAAYEQALAEAKAKAHGIAQETRDRLAAEIDAERAKVDTQIAEKLADADLAIAAAKDKALMEVNEIASDVTGQIVTDLTGKKASAAAVKKAVAAIAGN